jgi:hypothetical protein
MPRSVVANPGPVGPALAQMSDRFGILRQEIQPPAMSELEAKFFWRLRAWEARFEGVSISFENGGIRCVQTTWPGRDQYIQIQRDRSLSGIFEDGADIWRLDGRAGVGIRAIHSHGTELGENLDVYRAGASAR